MIQSAREVVMAYIKAMDDRDYAAARNYLGDNVRVKGPAGEAFRSPDEFLKMMEQQLEKYDFVTPKVTTIFSSWYQIKDGKIVSIQTVFDPRAFAAAQ